MANVLLGVTGSVAALKTPVMYGKLKALGHAVRVVATRSALYFFDPAAIEPVDPKNPRRNSAIVVLDEDEWPGHNHGRRYDRRDEVLHIELRRWADVLLIAPLDANTLAKLANGLCDNCLTCVWRAWDPARPVLLAPAMNTFMWEHPLSARHLRQLAVDAGANDTADQVSLENLPAWVNGHCPCLRLIAPVSKELACGDVGVGALAPVDVIVDAVDEALALLRS